MWGKFLFINRYKYQKLQYAACVGILEQNSMFYFLFSISTTQILINMLKRIWPKAVK